VPSEEAITAEDLRERDGGFARQAFAKRDGRLVIVARSKRRSAYSA